MRTTVLMAVVMFNSIKMLPSPHRPPFLDVVEDADDEDGGGDQEQQHDQQDLCIVLLKSKKFCHFYLQEPFHIELGLDFEPVLAVKLVLAQLAVTLTLTSRPVLCLGICKEFEKIGGYDVLVYCQSDIVIAIRMNMNADCYLELDTSQPCEFWYHLFTEVHLISKGIREPPGKYRIRLSESPNLHNCVIL